MKRRVAYIGLSLVVLALAMTRLPGISAQQVAAGTESSPQLESVSLMYRVVYKDQNGRIWKVNENGSGPEMIESETCGVVNTAATSSSSVIVTLQYSSTCWQIYNCPGSGVRIPLAVDSGKSVFLAHDSLYDRVYFGRNYDENLQKGDIYAVPSSGGNWTLLARNAYWCNMIGDRIAFMVDGYLGKKDIMTVRYDGTQYAGIGVTNDDEGYVGQFGSNVIFNRLVGGKQKDLFIAPATGGSGTALGKNFVYDDLFAGTGSDRIYYTVDYKNETNSLKSVLPNGTGAIEYVYYMNTEKIYHAEIQDRLVFESWGQLYSITKGNASLIQFPITGTLYPVSFPPTSFFGRLIYQYGREFGWTTLSVNVNNTDPVCLINLAKHDAFLSWTSRKIIIVVGCNNKPQNLLRAYAATGREEVKFGDAYTQPKVYILSTTNRHIYAYQTNARRGLWSVRSVWLNGSGDALLAESIPFEHLENIKAY